MYNPFLQKKSASPKMRVCIETRMSQEKKEFTDGVRESFYMSRSDVYTQGILALLEIDKDLHARIFVGDYVPLYRTKRNAIAAKKYKGTEYTTMYVYKLDSIDDNTIRLYYKDNCDIDDYNFKVWKCYKKKLNKGVMEEFPLPVGGAIPK